MRCQSSLQGSASRYMCTCIGLLDYTTPPAITVTAALTPDYLCSTLKLNCLHVESWFIDLFFWFHLLVIHSVCFSFFSGCQLGPRNESKNIQCQVNLGLKDTDLHNKHYVVYNNSQWTMCRLSRLVCLFENIFFYTLETPLQCVLYFSFDGEYNCCFSNKRMKH